MKLLSTDIVGVYRVTAPRHSDDRGWFQRVHDSELLRDAGLAGSFPQSNLSHNPVSGTLRGLHYQLGTPPESKLVRPVSGTIFDVVADLRAGSPSEGRWIGVELSASAGDALYIPTGCAHGFQTLEDHTTILYLMGAPYDPARAGGVRYDDSTFGIAWPRPVSVISDRDRNLPHYDPAAPVFP